VVELLGLLAVPQTALLRLSAVTIRLLEGFDLKKMGLLSADYIHTVAEVMKLAMADRDEYYADPRFVEVPMKELLSEAYAKIRRPLIDPHKASLELRPGDPYQMKSVKKGMRSFPTQRGNHYAYRGGPLGEIWWPLRPADWAARPVQRGIQASFLAAD